MTRTGKIARLPRGIREELNRRLQDGELHIRLVAWLNERPEVQAVMASEFGGRVVTEQNLSEWKTGGYRDWVRHEESRDLMRQLAEEGDDLEGIAEAQAVSDLLAPVFAAELARTVKELMTEELEPRERWQRLQECLGQLAELRRHDHRSARLHMELEKWERETAEQDRKDHEEAIGRMRQEASAPIWAAKKRGIEADFFGGGATGGNIADLMKAIHQEGSSIRLNPTESDQLF